VWRSIAEADELRTFRDRFGSIIRNWWNIMRRQKRLSWSATEWRV
jgi:ABC-type uncharacterized transport system fused permease/ATPase subunit